MFCGLRLVMLRNDWCVRFLRRLLDSYDYSNPLTPDDVADNLDAFLLNFHHEIRDARNLIKDHPEAVAAEIRKAIQKHPKLVA
jgi:phosphoserine phosphatase